MLSVTNLNQIYVPSLLRELIVSPIFCHIRRKMEKSYFLLLSHGNNSSTEKTLKYETQKRFLPPSYPPPSYCPGAHHCHHSTPLHLWVLRLIKNDILGFQEYIFAMTFRKDFGVLLHSYHYRYLFCPDWFREPHSWLIMASGNATSVYYLWVMKRLSRRDILSIHANLIIAKENSRSSSPWNGEYSGWYTWGHTG